MAERILGVFPEEGFTFAVLEVNGRLRLLQSYTRDRRLVDAAILDATPASPAPAPVDLTPAEKTLMTSAQSDTIALGPEGRAEGKLLLAAIEDSQRILEERHGPPSLAGLQALVQSDRLLTGRKFILYFSEGIAPSSDLGDSLQSIVGQANRAGDTICVVDNSRQNEQVTSAQQAAQASSILSGGNSYGLGSTPGSVGTTSPIGGPGTGIPSRRCPQ